MISVLGYGILFFFLLASLNGLKKYTKNNIIRSIAKKHQLFGGIAFLLAFIHFLLNITNGTTNLLGFVTLLLLFTTVMSGYLFKKLKNRNWYVVHRITGPLVLLTAIIHIFTN
jgi:hypothetical protein